jgi:hypothetical protein
MSEQPIRAEVAFLNIKSYNQFRAKGTFFNMKRCKQSGKVTFLNTKIYNELELR